MLKQASIIALSLSFIGSASGTVLINDFNGLASGWPNRDFSFSFAGADLTDGGASGTFGTYTDDNTSGGWTTEVSAGIDLTSVAGGDLVMQARLGVGHTATLLTVQLEDADGTNVTYFYPLLAELNTTSFLSLGSPSANATVGGNGTTLADFDWNPVRYRVQGTFSGEPTPFNVQIDNLSMVIPEPASLGLLGAGAVLAMRRRR